MDSISGNGNSPFLYSLAHFLGFDQVAELGPIHCLQTPRVSDLGSHPVVTLRGRLRHAGNAGSTTHGASRGNKSHLELIVFEP